jgi:hypothetical protein
MTAEIVEDFFKEMDEIGIPEPQRYLPAHMPDSWLNFLTTPSLNIESALTCHEIIYRIIYKVKGETYAGHDIYYDISNYIVELQMESLSRQKVVEYEQASLDDILCRWEQRFTVLDERAFKKAVRHYKNRLKAPLEEVRNLREILRYVKHSTDIFWDQASYAAAAASEIMLPKQRTKRLSDSELANARTTRMASLEKQRSK